MVDYNSVADAALPVFSLI